VHCQYSINVSYPMVQRQKGSTEPEVLGMGSTGRVNGTGQDCGAEGTETQHSKALLSSPKELEMT
jgi:hypothetical protein